MSPEPVSAYHAYAALLVVAAFACAVVGGIMTAVWLLTRVINRIPRDAVKSATYECGEEAVGGAWFRFNPRFYVVALVFLVFDVELVLMLPVLLRFLDQVHQGQGAAVLLKVGAFAAILGLGLAYAWRKGDFRWSRHIAGGRDG